MGLGEWEWEEWLSLSRLSYDVDRLARTYYRLSNSPSNLLFIKINDAIGVFFMARLDTFKSEQFLVLFWNSDRQVRDSLSNGT